MDESRTDCILLEERKGRHPKVPPMNDFVQKSLWIQPAPSYTQRITDIVYGIERGPQRRSGLWKQSTLYTLL